MTYGVPPTEPLNTPVENDNTREQGSAASTVAVDVNPAAQEEKERVIEGLNGVMDSSERESAPDFKCFCSYSMNWRSGQEPQIRRKEKAFDSYLTEINTFLTVQDESMSVTRKGSPFGMTLKSGG